MARSIEAIPRAFSRQQRRESRSFLSEEPREHPEGSSMLVSGDYLGQGPVAGGVGDVIVSRPWLC